MDGQPDILSFEPSRRGGPRRPGRRRAIRTAIAALLLAGLAVITCLALLVARQDATISNLRTARSQPPATTAEPTPVVAGSAMFTLPQVAGGGSFSMVVVTIIPRPNRPALTWLFIYGRHADPGQRYGLIDDICGGQYVAPSALADGTADQQGNVTIVAPALDLSPQAPGVWIMVYRWKDGAPLGGVQGPFLGAGTGTGTGARTFETAPRC